VLACPWVLYFLPICDLIPKIVRKAIEKRNSREPEPHYWARALRDVVDDGLKELAEAEAGHRGAPRFGIYDLANLMIFGGP